MIQQIDDIAPAQAVAAPSSALAGINTSAEALERMGLRKRAKRQGEVFEAVLAAQRLGVRDDFTITEVRDLLEAATGRRFDNNRVSGRISELVDAGRFFRVTLARPCSVTGQLCRPVFVPAHQVRLAGV